MKSAFLEMGLYHTMIRVLLIDDHEHVHDAVMLVLNACDDLNLVAQGFSGDDSLPLYQQHKPDIVLMDVVMPSMNGLAATHALRAHDPNACILVLSSYNDITHVRSLLEAGAIGYTLKSALTDQLADAIRAAHSGSTVMAPQISQKLLSQAIAEASPAEYDLTERELEVLRLMAQGLNNKEIASTLYISRSTVKFHLANLIEKMGVETRAEAIVVAAKSQLI